MEENFSMEWKIFSMEWKKIASMEYGKIAFHSIPYHALVCVVQTKANCIFSFIALTACNVASVIRVFPCQVWNSIPMKMQNLPKHFFKVKPKEYLLQL